MTEDESSPVQSSPSRRRVLRAVGSAAVGGSALVGLSGEAAASYTISDGEWNPVEYEIKDQLYTTTSTNGTISVTPDRIPSPGDFSVPNPKSVGFNVCTTLPNGNQVCTNMVDSFTPSTIPCTSKDVWKAPFEITSYEVDYRGVLSKTWSVSMYVAVAADGCVYFGGEEPSGNQFCEKANCNNEMGEVPMDVYEDEQVEIADTGGRAAVRAADGDFSVGTATFAAAAAAVAGGAYLGLRPETTPTY